MIVTECLQKTSQVLDNIYVWKLNPSVGQFKWKSTEQYFQVILFIMLFKIFQNVRSVNETLVFDFQVDVTELKWWYLISLYKVIPPF